MFWGVNSLQITLDSYTEVKEIKKSFGDSLSDIKDELDQHLDSINQNSMEIQANFDYLDSINQKVEKLESRIDQLTMLLLNGQREASIARNFTSQSMELSSKEKEVFLVLYTTQEPLSFEEISLRSQLPVYLVEELIGSMKIKNIPLMKKSFAGKVLVLLDDDFRELQAKSNVVNIKNNFLAQYT